MPDIPAETARLSPERVIEVAIGLYDGPRTGKDAPPAMAKVVLAELAEHGYQVVEAPPACVYEGPATLTDEHRRPLDVHVRALVNPREGTGDCTVLAAVEHHGAAFYLGTRCTLRLPDGRETTLTKVMSWGRLVELHGPQPAHTTQEGHR